MNYNVLYQRHLELVFEAFGFFFASKKLILHERHTVSQCVATPSPRWQRFWQLRHETLTPGLQKHTCKRSPTAACEALNAKEVRGNRDFNAKKMRENWQPQSIRKNTPLLLGIYATFSLFVWIFSHFLTFSRISTICFALERWKCFF